jgi:hypothetical protein
MVAFEQRSASAASALVKNLSSMLVLLPVLCLPFAWQDIAFRDSGLVAGYNNSAAQPGVKKCHYCRGTSVCRVQRHAESPGWRSAADYERIPGRHLRHAGELVLCGDRGIDSDVPKCHFVPPCFCQGFGPGFRFNWAFAQPIAFMGGP